MTSQPSFTSSLKEFQNVILPLLLPPAASFTTPLLDGFAAAHDPLMENTALFAGKADVGTVHVELDAALRVLARTAKADEEKDVASPGIKDASSDVHKLLQAVRQTRLRSKLRSMSGVHPSSEGNISDKTPSLSRASIIRSSGERREAFDKDVEKQEKEALDEFKCRLREAVLQS